jgi:hypothetical protein
MSNIGDLASKLSFYTPPESTSVPAPAASSWFGSKSAAPAPVVDEETAGLMSWASAKVSSVRSSVDDIANTRERFTTFAILAFLGVVCLVLAFSFLPIMILTPHKFALLFALGSILMIASFSFLRGHGAFVKHLASVERLPFSASYLVSLIGTLYSSLVMGSYLLTMIFSIIQVIALAYFLVSYIPGGTSALNFVGTVVGGSLKTVVVR